MSIIFNFYHFWIFRVINFHNAGRLDKTGNDHIALHTSGSIAELPVCVVETSIFNFHYISDIIPLFETCFSKASLCRIFRVILSVQYILRLFTAWFQPTTQRFGIDNKLSFSIWLDSSCRTSAHYHRPSVYTRK